MITLTISMNKSFIEYESLSASNLPLMEELISAASKVIRSGWYVLGSEVAAFEKAFSSYIGSRHCIGVANGLDALTLSIEALDLPKSSGIIVASNTYIATILAIVRAGHTPVLIEPTIETFNLDPALLEHDMTDNIRAVCVTHLFGKPCRMDKISAFTKKYNLHLIEDCAQSHGAKFQEKMTGTFGDAGCFSFYPTKNLGAFGDAGAIVTNDDRLADRLRHLRNYGSKQKYINEYVGSNSRLDELQAALLLVKLPHLDHVIQHKRMLADIYFNQLPSWIPLPARSDEEFDVFHIFAIRCPQRDALRKHLLSQGIKTEIHYPIPPHHQQAMLGVLAGQYPIAEALHATELSLPISLGHTALEIETVCAALRSNEVRQFFEEVKT